MQSRRHSFIETCASTAIGFGVAMTTQMAVYPLFGMEVAMSTNLALTCIFTGVSIVRGYFVRRLFNWWNTRSKSYLYKEKSRCKGNVMTYGYLGDSIALNEFLNKKSGPEIIVVKSREFACDDLQKDVLAKMAEDHHKQMIDRFARGIMTTRKGGQDATD